MELNRKRFVSYEYKEVEIHGDIDYQYLDALRCFGWEIEEDRSTSDHYTLKRFRHLVNKTELLRLQNNLESCFKMIVNLKYSVHAHATVVAIIVGLIATVFMICAIYSFIQNTLSFFWVMILGILALIGWILPYFLFIKVKDKR